MIAQLRPKISPDYSADSKQPPYSEEAERNLLAAILLQPDTFHEVEGIDRDSFWLTAYGLIWEAMAQAVAANHKPDMFGVVVALKASGHLEAAGGQTTIANLLNCDFTSAHWPDYASVIRDKAMARRLLTAGRKIASMAHDDEAPALARVDEAQQLLFALAENSNPVKANHVSEALVRTMDRLDKGTPAGLRGATFTGLYDLTGGIFPGHLHVAGGSSGTGKTHFGLAQALDYAHKFPVLFVSCEMTEDEITDRALARLSGVDSLAIQNGTLSDADRSNLMIGMQRLSEMRLHIYAKSNPSEADLRREVRRVARVEGETPKLVVLDYLQLLRWGNQNRVDDLDNIATTMKAIATDFGLTVLALSQVDRGIKNRQNKRPMIQDLVGAGAIENTANRIYLLYRDEKWNPDTSDRGLIEINVAKNRGGREGMVKMLIDLGRSWFGDIARGDF